MTKTTKKTQQIPQFPDKFHIIYDPEDKLYSAMNGRKTMTVLPGKMAEFRSLKKAVAYMATRNIFPVEA